MDRVRARGHDRHRARGVPRRHLARARRSSASCCRCSNGSASIRAANAANITPWSPTRRSSAGRSRCERRARAAIGLLGDRRRWSTMLHRPTDMLRCPSVTSRTRASAASRARRRLARRRPRHHRRAARPERIGQDDAAAHHGGHAAAASGRVSIDGAPIEQLTRRELARRIAVVPQETHSTFDFSVIDMVLMGRYPHLGPFELEGAADQAIAREALARDGHGGARGARHSRR